MPSPQQAQDQVKDIFASLDAKNRIQESVQLGLTDTWPDTLIPEQSEMMAIQTTDASYQLRVAIQYELAGEYTWRRTDKSKPERVTESES